jgi:hypothetical protein
MLACVALVAIFAVVPFRYVVLFFFFLNVWLTPLLSPQLARPGHPDSLRLLIAQLNAFEYEVFTDDLVFIGGQCDAGGADGVNALAVKTVGRYFLANYHAVSRRSPLYQKLLAYRAECT